MSIQTVRFDPSVLGIKILSRNGQMSGNQLLTPLGQLETYEVDIEPPFMGWQILKKPVGIKDHATDERTWLIELNIDHLDLSVFNDMRKVYRLEQELQGIIVTNDLQHLIISFFNSNSGNKLEPMYQPQVTYSNGETSGGDLRYPSIANFIADKFLSLSARLKDSGRKLSVVHLEDYFYNNTPLKNEKGLCHEVVEDAYKYANSNVSKEKPNGKHNLAGNGRSAGPRIFLDQEQETFLDYS